MEFKRISIVVVVHLIMIFNINAQSSTDQLLDATLNKMEKLFHENNMVGIVDFYTDNAQMFEPGGRIVKGSEDLKKYWKTLQGIGVSWDLDLLEVQESTNFVYSVIESRLAYKHGGQEVMSKTRALLIWERTKDGYKIKKDFFQMIK